MRPDGHRHAHEAAMIVGAHRRGRLIAEGPHHHAPPAVTTGGGLYHDQMAVVTVGLLHHARMIGGTRAPQFVMLVAGLHRDQPAAMTAAHWATMTAGRHHARLCAMTADDRLPARVAVRTGGRTHPLLVKTSDQLRQTSGGSPGRAHQ